MHVSDKHGRIQATLDSFNNQSITQKPFLEKLRTEGKLGVLVSEYAEEIFFETSDHLSDEFESFRQQYVYDALNFRMVKLIQDRAGIDRFRFISEAKKIIAIDKEYCLFPHDDLTINTLKFMMLNSMTKDIWEEQEYVESLRHIALKLRNQNRVSVKRYLDELGKTKHFIFAKEMQHWESDFGLESCDIQTPRRQCTDKIRDILTSENGFDLDRYNIDQLCNPLFFLSGSVFQFKMCE